MIVIGFLALHATIRWPLGIPVGIQGMDFPSAGPGTTYGPSGNPDGPPLFDNVFVNPSGRHASVDPPTYREFVKCKGEIRK